MKRYRIRKGSPLDAMRGMFVLMALIVIAGFGNHLIDGIW